MTLKDNVLSGKNVRRLQEQGLRPVVTCVGPKSAGQVEWEQRGQQGRKRGPSKNNPGILVGLSGDVLIEGKMHDFTEVFKAGWHSPNTYRFQVHSRSRFGKGKSAMLASLLKQWGQHETEPGSGRFTVRFSLKDGVIGGDFAEALRTNGVSVVLKPLRD